MILQRQTGAWASPQPFVAGILGAIGTDAFLSILQRTSPVHVWEFIASSVFGPVAFSSPIYIVPGLVMHIVIALVWAYLYAFVWGRFFSLSAWVSGGIVWGVVVDVCMDAVMAVRGVLEPQTPSAVIDGLITNVVFYGLIVAFYLSRTVTRARPT